MQTWTPGSGVSPVRSLQAHETPSGLHILHLLVTGWGANCHRIERQDHQVHALQQRHQPAGGTRDGAEHARRHGAGHVLSGRLVHQVPAAGERRRRGLQDLHHRLRNRHSLPGLQWSYWPHPVPLQLEQRDVRVGIAGESGEDPSQPVPAIIICDDPFQDQTIRFWDLRVNVSVNTLDNDRKDGGLESSAVTAVCVDPTGRLLVSGHADSSCTLYDIRGNRPIQRFYPHTAEIR